MEEIQGSVGDGGDNRQTDVTTVQQLLRRNNISITMPMPGILPGANMGMAPGVCDYRTIAHIEEFQRANMRMEWGDPALGIVTPGSATIFELNGLSGGRQPVSRTGPVRRLVYERRELAETSSGGGSPRDILTDVLIGHMRGSGRVMESRHQRIDRAHRVNTVRIKTSRLVTPTLGAVVSQTTTELWMQWGTPQAQIVVTTEQAYDGPTGPRNTTNTTRIPRSELNSVLPRGT